MSKTRQELLDLIDNLRISLNDKTHTKVKPAKPKLPKKEVSRLVAQLKEVVKPVWLVMPVHHDTINHEFELKFHTDGSPDINDVVWGGPKLYEKFTFVDGLTDREKLLIKQTLQAYKDGEIINEDARTFINKQPVVKERRKFLKAFDKEVEKLEKTYEIDLDEIEERATP